MQAHTHQTLSHGRVATHLHGVLHDLVQVRPDLGPCPDVRVGPQPHDAGEHSLRRQGLLRDSNMLQYSSCNSQYLILQPPLPV